MKIAGAVLVLVFLLAILVPIVAFFGMMLLAVSGSIFAGILQLIGMGAKRAAGRIDRIGHGAERVAAWIERWI